MVGVRFGDVHSYDDLGLLLLEKEIGSPQIKTNKVDLPGANGSIDLYKAVSGKPVYKDRVLSFKFIVLNAKKRWAYIYSKLLNILHGKQMRIIIDDDTNYFYEGIVSVNTWKCVKTSGEIVIDCDVDPFKYEIRTSDEQWFWDPFSFIDGIAQTTTYKLNGTKKVFVYSLEEYIPTIISDCNIQIVFNGVTHTMQAGTKKFYDIELKKGYNEFTFTGNGTVKVSYRRCIL